MMLGKGQEADVQPWRHGRCEEIIQRAQNVFDKLRVKMLPVPTIPGEIADGVVPCDE